MAGSMATQLALMFPFAAVSDTLTTKALRYCLVTPRKHSSHIASKAETMILTQDPTMHRDVLFNRFADRIAVNPYLDRKLVSYQADKEAPFYGWFKYREGFTSRLVH